MTPSHFLLVVAALLSAGAVSPLQGQDEDCPIVGPSDLPNLVTLALNSGAQGAATQYQVLRYNVVCLAQGTGVDLYRMTSVIVAYQEVGSTAQLIRQFHFQCENAEWTLNVLGNVANALSVGGTVLTGDLSTPVRTDCRYCSDIISNFTSDEHCVGKTESNVTINP